MLRVLRIEATARRGINCVTFVFVFLWSLACLAENYVVVGQMQSQIRYELQQRVTRGSGTERLELHFVVPQSFDSPTYRQEVQNFKLDLSPSPLQKKKSRDAQGNHIVSAIWNRPSRDIATTVSFDASMQTKLRRIQTEAPFPLERVPPEIEPYLVATQQVQADHPEIRQLASQLSEGVNTEFDAVQRVLTWLVDNVRYVTPPEKYDALYALQSHKGNCQNFSHLSAALMRALGIPVRIVNGVTLNQPYNISRQDGVLTFKMGQGRHSWIEVWFPQLGWVPFDPQQTELFVSNRFVRIEVGVDNDETINDGLLRWTQASSNKGRPRLQETFSAEFVSDQIALQGKRQTYGPRNLLLTPKVVAAFKEVKVAPPPPPPVISEPEQRKLRFTVPFVFGNLEFPEGVDFSFSQSQASPSGDNRFQMTRNFVVETAEYVTTKLTQYAQVFVLQKPLKLNNVGLALHKFGGDGLLWVELLEDKHGKPGTPIRTSDFVKLDQLSDKPGYRWVDFDFGRDRPVLMPGNYWIALGFTGSPIVNWYFTYGKPVGPAEGTRYKGVYQADWSGALSYEFNYRVMGLTNE